MRLHYSFTLLDGSIYVISLGVGGGGGKHRHVKEVHKTLKKTKEELKTEKNKRQIGTWQTM